MGSYYDNGTWADRNITCGEPTYEYDYQANIIQAKTAQVDRRWAQRDGTTPLYQEEFNTMWPGQTMNA